MELNMVIVIYMDDLVLLVKSKEESQILKEKVSIFLMDKLHLELNSKSRYYPNKMGINFDLVELERDILSTRDVDLRTYLMMSSNKDEDNSHAFLVYKDDKYYYWYEYSWLKYRGIHRYNNKENLFRDILNKYSKVINCEVEDIKLYMYDKPRYGINYNKFIRHVLAGSENLNK